MKLEDAFKESDIPAAKRVGNGYQVVIRYLPDNQGVLLRRVSPRSEDEEIFPHLGALIYKAIKKRYAEVRRYALDWQPLFYATGKKAQAAREAALAKSYEEEEHHHNIESEFTIIDSWDDEDNPYEMALGELFPIDFLEEYSY